MKRILISIASILIMAFVVVLFINAGNSPKDPKKAKTEVNKAESVAPCSAACNHSSGDKPATCDPATCTAHKEGKCDPATCTAHKEGEAKTCSQTAAGCQGTCHTKATEGNK